MEVSACRKYAPVLRKVGPKARHNIKHLQIVRVGTELREKPFAEEEPELVAVGRS